MYLTTGINREMAQFLEPVPAGSLASLVQFLGGPAAAAPFVMVESGRYKGQQGVSPRAIQRYLAQESGGATERRRISDANRRRLIEAGALKSVSDAITQLQRRGLHVSGEVQIIDPSGVPDGTRRIENDLTGAALDAFLWEWLQSVVGGVSQEEAADSFNDGLMNDPRAYNFPGAHIDAGPDALHRDDFRLSYAT